MCVCVLYSLCMMALCGLGTCVGQAADTLSFARWLSHPCLIWMPVWVIRIYGLTWY